MHIPVGRPECERQRVVVGRDAAAVTSDETHRWSAVALAGVIEEVADDHAEVVEVPVQRLEVLRCLQYEMPKPLHLGGNAGRPLRCVDPLQFMSEVEGV